jgi:23S rRNA pseudouridine955/2504/2580 synthase
VELKTGRTHQIRVHLSHLGFPLCGDDKYGDFALNKRLKRRGLKRMFLHAAKLAFRHPLTGATIASRFAAAGRTGNLRRPLSSSREREHG